MPRFRVTPAVLGILAAWITSGLALAQEAPEAGRPPAEVRQPTSRPQGNDGAGGLSSPANRSGKAKAGAVQTPSGTTAVVERDAAVIQEPSQGRPIFATPGESFYFVMKVPADMSGDVSFSLRHAAAPEVRLPLKPTTPPSYNDQYCSLLLLIPDPTEPGLYDIEVKTDRGVYAARHSVKVVDSYKKKFRFVHLSNMNVGDLGAPRFDDALPKEVNLLAPEFIIATGDYTEWARARDDASSWQDVLKYFEQFDAPVFMLCGAHDHESSFTRHVAAKPVDKIDYGNYHGLLLLDHAGNPIDQDFSQIQWIENDLKRSRQKTFTFIATNSDELALLDIWRENGKLPSIIKDHKIKLFLTGGSSDWDFKEFAGKLKDAPGLQYVRTHQSSTAMRDRATGISHYRVIEVDGDAIACVYPDDTSAEKLQHSIPAGRLRAFFDGPNDGSGNMSSVTIQNALNQGFSDSHVWLRVAKAKDGGRPSVAPGRLIQAVDCGKYWACNVGFDLPDKGSVRILAASNPADLPPALPVEIAVEGTRELAFSTQTTDFGLTYYTCDAPVSLKFTNTGRSNLTCWPVVRLNGSEIHFDSKSAGRLPLTLEPGKVLTVPLALDVRRVSAGRHALQVYLLEDPLARVSTFEFSMRER